MRSLISMAGILSSFGFFVGLIFSLFFDVETSSGRVLIALLPASFTFLATILLGMRDLGNYSKAKREIRAKLDEREAVSEGTFTESIPNVEQRVSLTTRSIIADFFDVSPAKIYADDRLDRDYAGEKFGPTFPLQLTLGVLEKMLAQTTLERAEFEVAIDPADSVADIASQAAKLIREIEIHDQNQEDE